MLDNVLVKLKEETEPVDIDRPFTREDGERLIVDFSKVFHSMEPKVKNDPDCREIFYSVFRDDFKVLLLRYINIFRVRVGASVIDGPVTDDD